MRQPVFTQDRTLYKDSGEHIESMITQTGLQANVRNSVRSPPHTLRHYYIVKNI